MPRAAICAGLFIAISIGLGAPGAHAEENAWVQGAPLNLRRGGGTEFKIIGNVKPGDRVEIIARGQGWTHVRTDGGRTGWIAAGYLDAVAPPTTRLSDLETHSSQLERDLDTATREVTRLRTSYDEVSGRDTEQRNELDRLTQDNAKLRAGSRWAELISGALILSTGMVLGSIWRGMASRGKSSRLRL